MKLIAALVAFLLIALPASAQSRMPGPWTFTTEQVELLARDQMDAWGAACAMMHMERQCRDIVPPRVGYALLPAYGVFDVGSRTVLVDVRLMGQPTALMVMAHEMIHYLQEKREPLTGPVTRETACAREKEAHTLVAALADAAKIKDPRIMPWSEAYKFYTGCRL